MTDPAESNFQMDPHTNLANDLFARHVPFLDHLQIRPIEASPGKAVFEVKVDEPHLRTLGILHGGVAASLLDTSMGMAAGTKAPDGHFVVTVQLNVNFIRPAWKGETLRTVGEVRHSGKQTAVSYGEIRTSENVLVASGTATFMYLPLPADTADALEKHADDSLD